MAIIKKLAHRGEEEEQIMLVVRESLIYFSMDSHLKGELALKDESDSLNVLIYFHPTPLQSLIRSAAHPLSLPPSLCPDPKSFLVPLRPKNTCS